MACSTGSEEGDFFFFKREKSPVISFSFSCSLVKPVSPPVGIQGQEGSSSPESYLKEPVPRLYNGDVGFIYFFISSHPHPNFRKQLPRLLWKIGFHFLF